MKDKFFKYLFTAGLLLIFGSIFFALSKNDWLSITTWSVSIGSIMLIILLFESSREKILKWAFGNYKLLNCVAISIYYKKFLDLLGILITAYVLGISILWGLRLGSEGSEIDFNRLHLQTLILMFFLLYAGTVLISTIGKSLRAAVEDECKKNNCTEQKNIEP